MNDNETIEEQEEDKEQLLNVLELLSVQMLHMNTVLTFLLEYNRDVPENLKTIVKANLVEIIEDFKDKTGYVTLFGLKNFINEYLR